MKDPWSILGIPRGSSQEDIKKTYRNLALKWHPDKNKDPVANERFKEINEAYSRLEDPLEEDEDILIKMTAEFLAGLFSSRKPVRGQTRKIFKEIHVTLEEIYSGVEREIDRGVRISIPRNVENYEKITKGSDIIVQVVTLKHPVWTRKGNNIHCKIYFSLKEALLGKRFIIKLLCGEKIEVDDNGPIDLSKPLLLRGRGLGGDALVSRELVWPTALTDEQKMAILENF